MESLTKGLTDNLTRDVTEDPKEGLREGLREDELRTAVRDRYAEIAQVAQTTTKQTEGDSACCGSGASCCSTDTPSTATWAEISVGLGYTDHDVASVPEGSNLGLGCGNPQAIADLKRGETVLDLGSGAGFDCFLAARQVGETGSVIGVDMTPQMISTARDNARSANATNIEFRLGEIERLPVADQAVDVIISNCVINLSPDKRSVFREAFRVLKPGGRLAISDIVASAPLPEDVRRDLSLYTGCMAGASEIGTLQEYLMEAGFADISIKPKSESREFIRQWAPEHALEDVVVSAVIQATKPASVDAARSTTVTSCCSAQEKEVCCEPEAKSECCDDTGTGECGCR